MKIERGGLCNSELEGIKREREPNVNGRRKGEVVCECLVSAVRPHPDIVG